MVGTRRNVRIWLASLVAIAAAGLAPAPVHAADDVPTPGFNDANPPLRVLDRPVHFLLVPALRLQQLDQGRPSRRPPKPTTILQIDSIVDDDSDMMLRIQAKKKKLIYFEYRF